MLEALTRRAERAIDERVFPGCVLGIARAGRRHVLPLGKLTYDVHAPAVRENTVYDLASVTKSVPAAALAAIFVAQRKLRFDDTVRQYIPELQNDFGATIEDLLRYRVRGARMSGLDFPTFEQVRTHIFETGFDGPPGERDYTNLPAFLLGVLLERVGGRILPALADEYFFGPLRMHETTFFPRAVSRVAPTELVGEEEVRGIVHDESARLFAKRRRAVGHAGLFSTAPDLLRFAEALLRGEFPAVANAAERGLGWHVAQRWFMGERCAQGTFGKTGFTGTSVVIDREKEATVIILSNRTYPQRPADAGSIRSAINALRADIADVVLA